MDINVFDEGFNKVAIIDNYASLMWCKRFNTVGALDMEIGASRELLQVLKKGYFLTRDDDTSVFRIEALELDTDDEGNDVLIVGGYDCQKILNQRIIWDQVNWNGTAENYIRELVTKSIIAPSMSARKITNFALKPARGFSETVQQQATYDYVGEKIEELCQTYGYGYRVTRENGVWYFDLYKGTDRTVNQDVNPRIIFSNSFENLISSKYNVDISDFKNVALVGGEGEGTDRKKRTVGSGNGLNRFEMFVDAAGISTNNGEIELPEYYESLVNEGKEKLAEKSVVTTFEGEVDAKSYKYKTDYNLGDVVTIKNQYGISVDARITEIIEIWDAEGYSIEPKFEYFEPIEYGVEGALLTENSIMMMTESAIPLLVESAPASAEGVKISELSQVTELYDGCCFPIVQNGETKKVTKSTLQSELSAASSLPIGAITASGADLSNDGFILCNGQALSRTTYSELFSKIGTTFGSGDGSTTFNVPDLRDKFIEGTGTNALGTKKEAGLPNITGSFGNVMRWEETYSGAFGKKSNRAGSWSNASGTYMTAFDFDASRSSSVYGKSTTVQPPALCLYFYIKARNVAGEIQNAIDDTKTTSSNVWSAEKTVNSFGILKKTTKTGTTSANGNYNLNIPNAIIERVDSSLGGRICQAYNGSWVHVVNDTSPFNVAANTSMTFTVWYREIPPELR